MQPVAVSPVCATETERRIGEAIGIAVGGLCLVAEWLLASASPSSEPIRAVAPVIIASALSGAITVAVVRSPTAIKAGLRSGIVAALVGSSLLLLLAAFSGSRSAQLLQIELFALLSFPPAVSAGMIGSIAASFALNPPNLLPSVPQAAPARVGRGDILFRCIVGAAMLCYAAPLAFLMTPATPRAAVAFASPHEAPQPPQWRYEKPAGFERLSASQVGVVATREIPDILTPAPLALSPSGDRLACFSAAGQYLKVVDLNTLGIVATMPFGRLPKHLAWSPDSQRLLYVLEGPAELGVVDIESKTRNLLPVPKYDLVPRGLPSWTKEHGVLFPEGNKRLDLDTLQVSEMTESDRSELTDLQRTSGLWSFRLSDRVRNYRLGPSLEWTGTMEMAIAISGNKAAFQRFLEVSVQPGDRLLSSADSSKLILVRRNSATACYLGRKDALVSFSAALPKTAGSSSGSACLFVCAPVINPLNGKAIAPDKERVKGIARVSEWKDGQAECWLDEEYAPIQQGDLVADIHTWISAKPIVTDSRWAPIIALDRASTLPDRKDAPALEKGEELSLKADGSVFPVANASFAPSGKNADWLATLTDFVRNHHVKSSQGDISGLIADYAPQVDYFDHGVIGPDFIRKDELAYHAPGYTIAEAVGNEISISPLENNLYVVSYTLDFSRQRSDGSGFYGVSEVELQVLFSEEGPKITHQRATVLQRKSFR